MAMATETRTIRRRGGLLSILGLRGLAAREAALGYAIVGLVYLFLLGFVFGPMLLAFYVSSLRWDALSPIQEAKFVGLGNYTDLVTDNRFLLSIYKDFEWSA